MGFASRAEADDYIQSRERYVLGAVHFIEGPGSQLRYVLQSNTTVRALVMLCARGSRGRWVPVAAGLPPPLASMQRQAFLL